MAAVLDHLPLYREQLTTLMTERFHLTPLVSTIIVGVGVIFYLLGGTTRRETAAEPVAPDYVPADSAGQAPR